MMLYAKEIVTSERVFAVIRKFSSSQQQRFLNDSNSNAVIPQWSASDYDQLLLVWISETVSALNGRIKRQMLETKVNVQVVHRGKRSFVNLLIFFLVVDKRREQR